MKLKKQPNSGLIFTNGFPRGLFFSFVATRRRLKSNSTELCAATKHRVPPPNEWNVDVENSQEENNYLMKSADVSLRKDGVSCVTRVTRQVQVRGDKCTCARVNWNDTYKTVKDNSKILNKLNGQQKKRDLETKNRKKNRWKIEIIWKTPK